MVSVITFFVYLSTYYFTTIQNMQTDNERYKKMASLAQIGWWEVDLTAGYYLSPARPLGSWASQTRDLSLILAGLDAVLYRFWGEKSTVPQKNSHKIASSPTGGVPAKRQSVPVHRCGKLCG